MGWRRERGWWRSGLRSLVGRRPGIKGGAMTRHDGSGGGAVRISGGATNVTGGAGQIGSGIVEGDAVAP